MSLKNLLLRRAAGDGNAGNTSTLADVTAKTLKDQSGNVGNTGNADFQESRSWAAETVCEAAAVTGSASRDLVLDYVTDVTHVTCLKNKGKSGNMEAQRHVTRVTAPVGTEIADWWRVRPAPAHSLVARLCEAGATVRTYIAGHGCNAEIEAPKSLSQELVAEIKAKGWRIIPGGKPNSEAENDIWLAGVPIKELDQ